MILWGWIQKPYAVLNLFLWRPWGWMHSGAHKNLKTLLIVCPRWLLPCFIFYIIGNDIIYTRWRGNVVRDKLDCCPVTIKVSSFIVKTPNPSQSIREIQHSNNKRTASCFHGIPSLQKTNTSLKTILNDPPVAQQWMYAQTPGVIFIHIFSIFICLLICQKGTVE